MPEIGQTLKRHLNKLANRGLRRLGYSEPMTRDAKREAWWWVQARAEAAGRKRRLLTGRVVVWTSPGLAELRPVEVPVAGDGEVTVEIAASVISPGTERALFLGLPNAHTTYPFRPGYSAAGVVIAAGADVVHAELGDVVAVRNVKHQSVVTTPANTAYRVPDGVPVEAAAFAQVAIICGQGLRRAAIQAGEPVGVVGAGLIGLMAQRLATAAGAGPVTVIARSRAKEEVALAGGAARFLATDTNTAEIEALALPVVIEATGDPRAVALAVDIAAAGGRVVLLGSPRGITTDVPVAAVRGKRLRVIGAHVRTLSLGAQVAGLDPHEREALAFFDHLSTGRLSVTDLLEVTVDPRDAGVFYRRLADARDLVVAHYDWTVLPAHERVSPGHLFRLPSLAARGTDMDGPPLPPKPTVTAAHGTVSASGATKVLRIGILGCGDIGVWNAAAIDAASNTTLVACHDPVEALAQEIASAHGADVCTTTDALLERGDIDAVLLSVPHHLHEPLGVRVAEAGKHVIVEKPLANDLDSARRLVDATEQAGVVLSVCFPQRYHPSVVEARRLLADGAVGRITGVLLQFLVDKPPSYWGGGYSGRAHSDWRRSRDRAGGGVLIMNLSHYIDLVRHLTGLEADVVNASTHSEDAAAEIEDAISINVRYADGALGSVFGSGAVRGTMAGATTELRVWGTDGHIVIEPSPRAYTLRALGGIDPGRWQALSQQKTDIRASFFGRLADAIGSGTEPDVTGADALAVQAFIEAAYLSASTGRETRPGALLDGREP